MKKFSITPNGYNIEEVNSYLDDVIKEVDRIISSNKEKDSLISSLNKRIENLELNEETILKAKKYDEYKDNINNFINSAKETSNKLKENAKKERDIILKEADDNAKLIISEALDRSREIEKQAEELRKKIVDFKGKMKDFFE